MNVVLNIHDVAHMQFSYATCGASFCTTSPPLRCVPPIMLWAHFGLRSHYCSDVEAGSGHSFLCILSPRYTFLLLKLDYVNVVLGVEAFDMLQMFTLQLHSLEYNQ